MATQQPPKRNRKKRKRRAEWGHPEAEAAVAELGGTLTVTNLGEHWTIRFTGRSIVRVDWFPSTGKVVVNCHYGTATRRKTWRRLLQYVNERLVGKGYSSRQVKVDDA